MAQASGGQSQLFLPLEGRSLWGKCEQMWNDAGVLGTQKGTGVEFPVAPRSGPAGSLLAGPFLQFVFTDLFSTTSCGIQDLSFWARDQTCAPSNESMHS